MQIIFPASEAKELIEKAVGKNFRNRPVQVVSDLGQIIVEVADKQPDDPRIAELRIALKERGVSARGKLSVQRLLELCREANVSEAVIESIMNNHGGAVETNQETQRGANQETTPDTAHKAAENLFSN